MKIKGNGRYPILCTRRKWLIYLKFNEICKNKKIKSRLYSETRRGQSKTRKKNPSK